MKKLFLLVTLVVGVIAFVLPTNARALTFELNYEFSEAQSPTGPAPWLTATFTDIAADTVRLTMTANGLVNKEFVDEWLFNFDTNNISLNPADFTHVSSEDVGIFGPLSVEVGVDDFPGDGGGLYDIKFVFDNAPPADRFDAGDSVTYDITATGLSASSFEVLSTPHGDHGIYFSAAHIQAIGSGDDPQGSGWIGPKGETPIPEPTTILLVGLGLLGFAGFLKKLRK